ncbi:MAG TPA: LuxR C-terminal-related transcriptional regulator [Actinomycetota bacterium]|nr:LuxR C-terminal-related transcriptional regulator [Actinomycetota bacterium]
MSRTERGLHRLPLSRTSFVGRAHELADLAELLTAGHVVTLTGPGGSGKSRLALESAGRLAGMFPDGLVLVELAGVASPELAAPAVAGALGIRGRAGHALSGEIAEAIGDRRLLLLLDNCEHLVAACAHLVQSLIGRCPDVGILSTSRTPLRVAGERVVAVPPLRIAEEAVPLFVDRAQAAQARFALDDASRAAIEVICRRLDGIPLAIELAAPWVAVMHPSELVPLLDRRFDVLKGGARGAAERQRTLWAAVDWSHALLAPEERALYRRLSVFAGGFTRGAAEAVCAPDGLDGGTILAALASLCASSMVVAEPAAAGGTRYRLLETLRAYGLERLEEAGEGDACRARHLDYFTTMAESAHEQRVRGGGRSVVDVLEAERDNVRVALDWGQDHDPDAALGLAGTLVEDVRRSLFGFQEMEERLRALLGRSDDASARRARALLAAGYMALAAAEDAQGQALAAESCRLYEALGDRWGEAWAHLALGMAAWLVDDLPVALSEYRRSEVLHAELANELGCFRARVRGALARASVSPPPADFLAEFDALVKEGQRLGDAFGTALAHSWWAMLTLGAGPGGPSRAAARSGAPLSAYRSFWQAIELLRPSGDPIIQLPLAGLGACFAESDPDLALRLLGAAEATFRLFGLRRPPVLQRFIGGALDRARMLAGEPRATLAFAAGQELSFDEAVALAGSRIPSGGAYGRTARPGDLTSREEQIAHLVAAGLTNREIAESLVLSVRTVESHIDRILTKLGFHSRSRIAAWLAEEPARRGDP